MSRFSILHEVNIVNRAIVIFFVGAQLIVDAKPSPFGNCSLSDLTIWFGEKALQLKPAFSQYTLNYTADLDYLAGPLWIDPVPFGESCEARRTDSVEYIQPGAMATLAVVTNGAWPKNYTVLVTRRSGLETTLANLSARSAQILPAFKSHIHNYALIPVSRAPLALLGIPTDSGETLRLLAITPQNVNQTCMVEAANDPGLLPVRGFRRITLGRLQQRGITRWILRLPSPYLAGGKREVALPADVVIQVFPAAIGKQSPALYRLQLRAPGAKLSAAIDVGAVLLHQAADALVDAAKMVAVERASAERTSKHETSSSTTRLSTTTVSTPAENGEKHHGQLGGRLIRSIIIIAIVLFIATIVPCIQFGIPRIFIFLQEQISPMPPDSGRGVQIDRREAMQNDEEQWRNNAQLMRALVHGAT